MVLSYIYMFRSIGAQSEFFHKILLI